MFLFLDNSSRSCVHVKILNVDVDVSISGQQLQELICQILQGHLVMFRKDSFLSILSECFNHWYDILMYMYTDTHSSNTDG